jgi:hypothetical protein
MTDTTTEAETLDVTTDPEAPVDGPEAPMEPPETDDAPDGADQHDDGQDGGNREAARYRRRLREVEAERDALTARVETMQRTEAERLASKHLAKGAALWIGDTQLADLLDDDGNVDASKVADRAQYVREEFGLSKARSGLYVAREGENPPPHRGGDSMIDAVMGNYR